MARKQIAVTIYVDPAQKKWLEQMAQSMRTSVSAAARLMLNSYRAGLSQNFFYTSSSNSGGPGKLTFTIPPGDAYRPNSD